VIAWSKDLGRSIDYLETRPDIDASKIAYQGRSWGGAMGSVLPAVEDRIKACVLVVPGFNLQKSLPEVDELNFAPRVKVPVLMLNGRFDFVFPPQASQEPMFRLLGTPKQHKRHVVYDTGHNIPESELIKETLNWLDRYLGSVKLGPGRSSVKRRYRARAPYRAGVNVIIPACGGDPASKLGYTRVRDSYGKQLVASRRRSRP